MLKPIRLEASPFQIAPAPRGLRRQPSCLRMESATGKSFFSDPMRRSSLSTQLLSCCVLSVLRVAGAMRVWKRKALDSAAGRERNDAQACAERARGDSAALPRFKCGDHGFLSPFFRCRRPLLKLYFHLFVLGASKKKVLSQHSPPLFSTRGAASFALPSSHLHARVLCSCASEQEHGFASD